MKCEYVFRDEFVVLISLLFPMPSSQTTSNGLGSIDDIDTGKDISLL